MKTISIFNHQLFFVLTTRHERMQNGTSSVSISLIGCIHCSRLESNSKRTILQRQKYFANGRTWCKGLSRFLKVNIEIAKQPTSTFFFERKCWKFLKWFLWVEMIWCFHLRAAHVPSSPFCLFNSSSSLRIFFEIHFWKRKTYKIHFEKTLSKYTFFVFEKKVHFSCSIFPPLSFQQQQQLERNKRAFNLESKGKSKDFYHPYFTISSLKGFLLPILQSQVYKYETSSGHFLLVFVFSFNETINIRFEHYLIF